jgi:dipeptidyl-peptidase-4
MRLVMKPNRFLVLFIAPVLLPSFLNAQDPRPLGVEWFCGSGPSEIAATPQYKWLNDGRCILYDMRKPAGERTLEVLTPSEGSRVALVDPRKALSGLRAILEDGAPPVLPFPSDIDAAGRRALYVFAGDLILLDIPSSSFTRLDLPRGVQSCAGFSPDGEKVSYVRGHDIYVYDVVRDKETRLTFEGNDTVLNGTLSWLHWEEIFERHGTGHWWSPDSRAIAFLRTDESGVSLQHYVDVTYDDNVHIQNAWRFADELIGANKLFEMVIYPVRMHGIADEPARIHLYNTMLDFWRRNL